MKIPNMRKYVVENMKMKYMLRKDVFAKSLFIFDRSEKHKRINY